MSFSPLLSPMDVLFLTKWFWLCLILLTTARIDAQGFGAEVVGGFNLSQIDGDRLSGYNHIGQRAGFRVYYPQKQKSEVSTTFLYDVKGSSSRFNLGPSLSRETLRLHYLSLLAEYALHDWYSETKGRYLVSFRPGLLLGRLFSVNSTNPSFDNRIDRFRSWDVALSVAASYTTGKKSSIKFSFERSLLRLYKARQNDEWSFQSFLINLQFNYILNL